MSLEVLQAIITVCAFFLCRPKSNVQMYEFIDTEKTIVREISFVELRNYMEKHRLNQIDKKVLLGKGMTIEVRLIICLLPQEVVSKRLRDFPKEHKGKKPSAEFIARSHFNLFITNAPAEYLCTKMVAPLYTIRWQIELFFKVWKAIAHIDKVKKVKKDRFECYVYSKLLIIVLCWKLFWSVNRYIYSKERKIVSGYKFFKMILHNIKDISKLYLEGNTCNTIEFLYNICQTSKKYLLCETKQINCYWDIILYSQGRDAFTVNVGNTLILK